MSRRNHRKTNDDDANDHNNDDNNNGVYYYNGGVNGTSDNNDNNGDMDNNNNDDNDDDNDDEDNDDGQFNNFGDLGKRGFAAIDVEIDGAPKKKPRKVYVCRKCGEPKRGHQCPIPDLDGDVEGAYRAMNTTLAVLGHHTAKNRKKSASITVALSNDVTAVKTAGVALKNVPSSHYYTPQYATAAALQSAAAATTAADLIPSSVESNGPAKSQRQTRLLQQRATSDRMEQLHRQHEQYEMYQRQQRQLHQQQSQAMQQHARKQPQQQTQQQYHQQQQQHHHQQHQQQLQQQLQHQQFPQQKTGLPDLSSLLQEMGLPHELDPLPVRPGQLRHHQNHKQNLQSQPQLQPPQQQQQQTNNEEDDAEVAAFTKYFSSGDQETSTIW